jgi:hypothetical protein
MYAAPLRKIVSLSAAIDSACTIMNETARRITLSPWSSDFARMTLNASSCASKGPSLPRDYGIPRQTAGAHVLAFALFSDRRFPNE